MPRAGGPPLRPGGLQVTDAAAHDGSARAAQCGARRCAGRRGKRPLKCVGHDLSWRQCPAIGDDLLRSRYRASRHQLAVVRLDHDGAVGGTSQYRNRRHDTLRVPRPLTAGGLRSTGSLRGAAASHAPRSRIDAERALNGRRATRQRPRMSLTVGVARPLYIELTARRTCPRLIDGTHRLRRPELRGGADRDSGDRRDGQSPRAHVRPPDSAPVSGRTG